MKEKGLLKRKRNVESIRRDCGRAGWSISYAAFVDPVFQEKRAV